MPTKNCADCGNLFTFKDGFFDSTPRSGGFLGFGSLCAICAAKQDVISAEQQSARDRTQADARREAGEERRHAETLAALRTQTSTSLSLQPSATEDLREQVLELTRAYAEIDQLRHRTNPATIASASRFIRDARSIHPWKASLCFLQLASLVGEFDGRTELAYSLYLGMNSSLQEASFADRLNVLRVQIGLAVHTGRSVDFSHEGNTYLLPIARGRFLPERASDARELLHSLGITDEVIDGRVARQRQDGGWKKFFG